MNSHFIWITGRRTRLIKSEPSSIKYYQRVYVYKSICTCISDGVRDVLKSDSYLWCGVITTTSGTCGICCHGNSCLGYFCPSLKLHRWIWSQQNNEGSTTDSFICALLLWHLKSVMAAVCEGSFKINEKAKSWETQEWVILKKRKHLDVFSCALWQLNICILMVVQTIATR